MPKGISQTDSNPTVQFADDRQPRRRRSQPRMDNADRPTQNSIERRQNPQRRRYNDSKRRDDRHRFEGKSQHNAQSSQPVAEQKSGLFGKVKNVIKSFFGKKE